MHDPYERGTTAGLKSPAPRKDYCLHGCSFATSEERQAAATGHHLWKEYLKWDGRRHCGAPDMDDDHDREVFEAFIHGAYLESQADLSGSAPGWLLEKTFCVEYSPNCVKRWLVRLPGKSGVIDKRQYIFKEGLTGDFIGHGDTFEEAANAAREAQNSITAKSPPS